MPVARPKTEPTAPPFETALEPTAEFLFRFYGNVKVIYVRTPGQPWKLWETVTEEVRQALDTAYDLGYEPPVEAVQ